MSEHQTLRDEVEVRERLPCASSMSQGSPSAFSYAISSRMARTCLNTLFGLHSLITAELGRWYARCLAPSARMPPPGPLPAYRVCSRIGRVRLAQVNLSGGTAVSYVEG